MGRCCWCSVGDDIDMVQIGRRRGFEGKLQSRRTDFGQKKGGSLHKCRGSSVRSPIYDERPS
eukprot:scaffold5941_cov102-Skeletonema_dohrnii-CCMP3373.AAC.1